jgi:hypothetical protein
MNNFPEKPIKNKQRKIVNVWIVLTLLFIAGIFAPGIFGMDGMNGGFALSFFCGFLAVTGLVVIIIYNKRANRLDKLIHNENVIARWNYTPGEWSSYAELDYSEEKKDKKNLFLVVVVISVIIGVILTVLLKSIIIFLTIIGIIVIVAIPAFIGPRLKHKRNIKHPGYVLISDNSVYMNGSFYSWDMASASLNEITYDTETVPHCLVITYSYITRYGMQTDTIRVPVPAGKDTEVPGVIQSLRAAV